MNRMSVKAQLALLLGILSALMISLGILGLNGMGSAEDSLEAVYRERVVPLQELKIIADMYAINVVDAAHKVRDGAMSWDEGRKSVAAATSTIHGKWEAYLAAPRMAAEEKLVQEAKPLLAVSDRTVAELASILEARDSQALQGFAARKLYPAIDPISGKFSELVDVQLDVAKAEYTTAAARYQVMVYVFIASIASALLASAVLGFLLMRGILAPLDIALDTAGRIADGDLTHDVAITHHNEFGLLLQALARMRASLRGIVGGIKETTETIGTASRQIAAGNADLSQRTEEQASSLEETASAMEELTSTVRQNAESALQANQLAAGASAVAVKGGQVVGQVVQTMSSINESSKKIVEIIAVIDGIAFQTNILALNAAVEAARAGEQGRGFAVVATEVRTLAQRSAAAAKEIKQLISDSVGKVEDGTRLVDEAGRTMDEIVSSVKRVTDIMGEISTATQEQRTGIEQVNQAVTQMDQMTQQNAALVEEAAAAAASMQDQTQSLTQAVAIFSLDAEQPRVPARRRAPSARPVARPAAARATHPPAAAVATTSSSGGRRLVAAGGGDGDWTEF